MLNSAGDAILCDFGVSSQFEGDNDTVEGTAGSIKYFAPEIVRTGKKNVKGKQTDVWALGITFYNLKTNKFPYNATSLLKIQQEILNNEPEYSIITDDALFVDLLKTMLEKDQEKRATIEQISRHPWITKNGTALIESSDSEEFEEQEAIQSIFQENKTPKSLGLTHELSSLEEISLSNAESSSSDLSAVS